MSRISRISRITCVYAFCHWVVDLACITTLMGAVVPQVRQAGLEFAVLAVLMYDMLAFCLQLPVGALLDVWGRRQSQRAAMASFALAAMGVSAAWMGGTPAMVAAVAFVALGNALFHCVGGVEVLGESDGRAAPSGMFIATGALGVFLGGLSAFTSWVGTPPLLLALLVACAAAVLHAPSSDASEGLSLSLDQRGWLAVALLAATVALRSYTGMVMAFPWKAAPALTLAAVCAVVAGKAVGGVAADALGAPLASALSLGLAALLFLPSWTSVPAGIAATFLFNFTMAITLSSLAALMPRAKGLAFGIASFSLAIGALPALLGFRVASSAVLCALSLASLALLELGLSLMGPRQNAGVTIRPHRHRQRP